MYEINQQTRQIHLQRQNRLTAVKRGVGGLGEKGEGIKQRKKTLIDTDNSMGTPEGKAVGEGGQMVMGGDLTWGGEHTIQYTDDVL